MIVIYGLDGSIVRWVNAWMDRPFPSMDMSHVQKDIENYTDASDTAMGKYGWMEDGWIDR